MRHFSISLHVPLLFWRGRLSIDWMRRVQMGVYWTETPSPLKFLTFKRWEGSEKNFLSSGFFFDFFLDASQKFIAFEKPLLPKLAQKLFWQIKIFLGKKFLPVIGQKMYVTRNHFCMGIDSAEWECFGRISSACWPLNTKCDGMRFQQFIASDRPFQPILWTIQYNVMGKWWLHDHVGDIE